MKQKSDNNFEDMADLAQIKTLSISGGMVSLASKVLISIIQLIGVTIMARLLIPEDYGLVAMVTALIQILEHFREFGITNAIVQEPTIDHQRINSIFWLSIGMALALFALTSALAPVVCTIYKKPELFNITIVLATGFIITNIGSVHWAIMMRNMRFKTLAIIQCLGMVLAVIAGVFFSAQGYGYWSIIIFLMIPRLVQAIGPWLFCSWRPSFSFKPARTGKMLSIGGFLMLYNLVFYFAVSLDAVLIGIFFKEHYLGLYSRAMRLILMCSSIIYGSAVNVVISSLSRLRDHPDQFRKMFLAAIYIITAMTIPFCLCFLLEPSAIISGLFGRQWNQAAPYLRLLAPIAILLPLNKSCEMIYISTGRTKGLFVWGVFFSLIMITAFTVGINFGINGLASAYSIAMVITLIPGWFFATKTTVLSLYDIANAIRPVVFATFLALIVYISTNHLINMSTKHQNNTTRTCIVLIASLLTYASFMLWDLMQKSYIKNTITSFIRNATNTNKTL